MSTLMGSITCNNPTREMLQFPRNSKNNALLQSDNYTHSFVPFSI